jgi:hypothetical protein
MIDLPSKGQDIQSVREYIVNRGGFQHPSRYKVKFSPGSDLPIDGAEMYPLSINLPEQSIKIFPDFHYTTPRHIPITVETGVVLMNFILMSDWKERTFFEKWMHTISYGSVNSIPGIDVVGCMPYNKASACTFSIWLLNGNSPASYNAIYVFTEAYPVQLTPVEFDSTIGGYATFQVGLFVRSKKLWKDS